MCIRDRYCWLNWEFNTSTLNSTVSLDSQSNLVVEIFTSTGGELLEEDTGSDATSNNVTSKQACRIW